MRTVYSELRGRIVDAGIVGTRVWRNNAPNDATLPYVEIVETSPTDRPVEGHVVRTFEVNLFQLRSGQRDPAMALRIRDAFDRKRWVYFVDDALTVAGQIIARVPSIQQVDRPEDGVLYDSITVTTRCGEHQP